MEKVIGPASTFVIPCFVEMGVTQCKACAII